MKPDDTPDNFWPQVRRKLPHPSQFASRHPSMRISLPPSWDQATGFDPSYPYFAYEGGGGGQDNEKTVGWYRLLVERVGSMNLPKHGRE